MKRFLLLLVVGLLGTARVAAAQNITGEWDAAMSTPGGVRTARVIFKQDGEKLTGTIKREAGDAALAGTVKGNAVEFSYTVEYNGNALTLSISAKLDGDTLTGTVSFGGQAEDSWSARRVKAGAKPGADAAGDATHAVMVAR